jgi:hypothetical protein
LLDDRWSRLIVRGVVIRFVRIDRSQRRELSARASDHGRLAEAIFLSTFVLKDRQNEQLRQLSNQILERAQAIHRQTGSD